MIELELEHFRFFSRLFITLIVGSVLLSSGSVNAEQNDVDENFWNLNWDENQNEGAENDIELGGGLCLSGMYGAPVERRHVGIEPTDPQDILPICKNEMPEGGIPEEFDSRVKWPQCPSIWEIKDQGVCASCWAVAPTSVMTDRYCIEAVKEGIDVEQIRFSEEDLLSCGVEASAWSSNPVNNQGCQGGNVEKTWRYLEANGTVSGGSYNSHQGCRSYTIEGCVQFGNNPNAPREVKCKINDVETPKCHRRCSQIYGQDYEDDIVKVKNPCAIEKDNDTQIQLEIMNNGPVVAVIRPFEEFLKFDPADDVVYNIKPKRMACNWEHAVRIIGWGTQNNAKTGEKEDYWIVANSWNYFWGKSRGFVKIIRGEQDNWKKSLNIAAKVSTATPILRSRPAKNAHWTTAILKHLN